MLNVSPLAVCLTSYRGCVILRFCDKYLPAPSGANEQNYIKFSGSNFCTALVEVKWKEMHVSEPAKTFRGLPMTLYYPCK